MIGRIILLGIIISSNAYSDSHHYQITIDPPLRHLKVHACFKGKPIYSLTAAYQEARRFLESVSWNRSDVTIKSNHHIRFHKPLNNQCIDYQVNLSKAEKLLDQESIRRFGPDLVLSPSFWMWTPKNYGATHDIRVTVKLPTGISFSTPWKEIRHNGQIQYLLQDTPKNWLSVTAFGRFKIKRVKIAQTYIRVALINISNKAVQKKLVRWLLAAAQAQTSVFGRFPATAPQILVIPSARGATSAIVFGEVSHGGGYGIHFFINPDRPKAEFMKDWVAAHEFSHLLLPFTNDESKWLSEGMAAYYQYISRARVGQLTAFQAWDELVAGFQRGLRGTSGKPLRQASLTMHATHAYMRVYWSGAAIVLLADVRLRQKSNGRQSLDTVLKRFKKCCFKDNRVWSAKELMQEFDRISKANIFISLYQQHSPSTKFPDLAELYRQLGIKVIKNSILLDNSAPLSNIRHNITRNAP